MDAGAFGCLGIGVPYAVAAALARPDRQVVSVTGDGAFGINAMEIDTAVRHKAQDRGHRVEQRRLEHRAPRPGDQLRRPGRRHDAGAFRLRRPWRARSARMASGSRSRRSSPGAIERALANAPALVDVVTSQTVVSSDATKGLGFVPEFQPLTAWDDLERKRRGLL